jgi:TonB family protein
VIRARPICVGVPIAAHALPVPVCRSCAVPLTIDGSGSVANVQVSRNTSFPLLDEDAAEMVRRASVYDPIPAEFERDHWTLPIPNRFELAEIC